MLTHSLGNVQSVKGGIIAVSQTLQIGLPDAGAQVKLLDAAFIGVATDACLGAESGSVEPCESGGATSLGRTRGNRGKPIRMFDRTDRSGDTTSL